jgi:hypothetical protein
MTPGISPTVPGLSWKWSILLLSLALLPGSWGCQNTSGPTTLDTPIEIRDDQGNLRQYTLYLPAHSRRNAEKRPLLVYFHGVISPGFKHKPTLKTYTGSPVEETGLIEFCREKSIVLLVPKPLYEYRFLECTSRGWVIAEELNGVEKIIDTVVARYDIAPQARYLAGISAGAGFCHFLANHRPDFYHGLISHSQGYVDPRDQVLAPARPGPGFGVVFCHNKGDYPNIIALVNESNRLYRLAGYRTVLLRDVPPTGHAWSITYNPVFWRYLQKLSEPNPTGE